MIWSYRVQLGEMHGRASSVSAALTKQAGNSGQLFIRALGNKAEGKDGRNYFDLS